MVEGGTGELNRRKKQQEESELKGVSSAEAVLEEVAVTEEKQAE